MSKLELKNIEIARLTELVSKLQKKYDMAFEYLENSQRHELLSEGWFRYVKEQIDRRMP